MYVLWHDKVLEVESAEKKVLVLQLIWTEQGKMVLKAYQHRREFGV